MLKILAVGDLHLRKTAPAMRKDDFFWALSGKLDEILITADSAGCRHIVFPGDIFDRVDAPHDLVEFAIRKFSQWPMDFYFVFGQHDLRYHTLNKHNSPLGVLIAGLGEKAHSLVPDIPVAIRNDILMYGCSWGEEIPKYLLVPDDYPEDADKILVMHRPISDVPIPWDHPDFLLAEDLIKKTDADIFITGDNHAQFIYKDRVINMGSVMRQTSAQIDHKPAVCMIEFDAGNISLQKIPLQISKNVFDLEKIEEKQAKDEKIAAFVTGLQGSFDPELKFVDNLRLAIKKAPKDVKEIIKGVLDA